MLSTTLLDNLIVSVPHCGTRFLRNASGINQNRHTHGRPLQTLFGALVDRRIFVPLRNPEDVWHSWVNRIGTPDEIDLSRWPYAWMGLAAVASRCDCNFIPIDVPGVRDELFSFYFHDRPLPNWDEKVGSVEQRVIRFPIDCDWHIMDWIYEMDFIHRFYHNPVPEQVL